MTNGKQKGNNFERKVANTLSKRFETYLGESKGFRRNGDSGSFFGGSNKSRANEYNLDYACFGDIISPKTFKFVVECKHYKSPPTFQSIINQDVKQWDTWLGQVLQDAQSANKHPMLIIKYNNVNECVFLKEPLSFQKEILVYKDFYLYQLDVVLSQPDTFFF